MITNTPNDPTLFLDIDGIANTDEHYRLRAAAAGLSLREFSRLAMTPAIMREMLIPELVARVQEVCTATGAHYVLISGWCDRFIIPEDDDNFPCHIRDPRAFRKAHERIRRAHNEAIVAALAEAGLTAPCAGVLWKQMKMSEYRNPRASLIREYLTAFPGIKRWAVVDDDITCYGRIFKGRMLYEDNLFDGHGVHPPDGIRPEDEIALIDILNRQETP